MTITVRELANAINNLTYPVIKPRQDVQDFVSSIMMFGDDLTKISLSEAATNLREWIASGVEIPEGITPEELMIAWNQSI